MDFSHWNLPNSFWAPSTALRYLAWHLKLLPRKVAISIVFPSCLKGLKPTSVRRVTWGCKSSQSVGWAGFSNYLIGQGIFTLRHIFDSLWADSEWRLTAQSNRAAAQSREQLAGLMRQWTPHTRLIKMAQRWYIAISIKENCQHASLKPIIWVKSLHASYTLGSDPLARITSLRLKVLQSMHHFLLEWKGNQISSP